MKEIFKYGRERIELVFPQETMVYKSDFPIQNQSGYELTQQSLNHPIGSEKIGELFNSRREGKVVIVISDITRPIKYADILPSLLDEIQSAGISDSEVLFLIATGMHRPSTHEERIEMVGEEIANSYSFIDHNAEDEDSLAKVEGKSWSGAEVYLNKHYVNAGFRIVTGLVEPHFMAGFSGGRKAICPGLASLSAVQNFHGYEFISHPDARNGNLLNNPLHEEATSIERLCPADYAIHIIQDNKKNINKVYSGEITASHQQAIEYVRDACCRKIEEHADLVVTSSGGYPLDATFYQCVKGFISCLPAVRTKGEILAFGSCLEGIGSPEYIETIKKYSDKHMDFIDDIRSSEKVIKDQWQFQMHVKALMKIGAKNLYFFTSGLKKEELAQLSVNPQSVHSSQIQTVIQEIVNVYVRMGKTIAIFPEGPYCVPL